MSEIFGFYVIILVILNIIAIPLFSYLAFHLFSPMSRYKTRWGKTISLPNDKIGSFSQPMKVQMLVLG